MRDILGQRYGSFTVIRKTKFTENGFAVWRLKCECGKKIKVSWKYLHDKKIPPCPNKNCWPSRRHKKQIETVEMWDRINAERYQKKCKENKLKHDKEKEARKKKRHEEGQQIMDADNYDKEHGFLGLEGRQPLLT